jgi:hypothetical protein
VTLSVAGGSVTREERALASPAVANEGGSVTREERALASPAVANVGDRLTRDSCRGLRG